MSSFLVWFTISSLVTAVLLLLFKVRPGFGTGMVCGIAFMAGVASQHYQLF